MEQKTEDFHGLTHHESILIAAIGLAHLMRRRANPDLIKPGLKMMAHMITDADLDYSKNLAAKGYEKCGCEQCQNGLGLIGAVTKLKETMDKMAAPEPELPKADGKDDPEDPFRTFAA